MQMNPTERIMAVAEGREVDRVPTFIFLFDAHPVHQVLGFPKIKETTVMFNPVSRFILDRWGTTLGKNLQKFTLQDLLFKVVETTVKLGFDAVCGMFIGTGIMLDSKTIQYFGVQSTLMDDGHGNVMNMYQKPVITSPEAYEAYPHFPDPDFCAHESYELFKKLLSKYGDKICIIGTVWSGAFQIMQLAMGLDKFSLYIRKEPDFIRRFIARVEEFSMKTKMAMMDAGIKVIIDLDDMAFKTGPQMNPKTIDAFFGPLYTRICKAVHDRGGKMFLHACGDNTQLFDYFIKWGFDGGHAYETTSNVDIHSEKKIHGDRFTIIGGMGVDYLLTERSRPEEVVEKTKELIKNLAPGGRFILAPALSHPNLDMSKVKIMLETVKEFGKYPIRL